MTTLSVQASASIPSFQLRGARIAADLFGKLLTVFASESLESHEQTRSDEAEHVRSLARRVQATDPGFASDLFAAAARHEGLDY